MILRPILATQITQHTLWQAITGDLPPLALPPEPIANAGFDSRDMSRGDLFIAWQGEQTDGHLYVGQAIQRGASAVICKERARAQAETAGALIIDCRRSAAQSPTRLWDQAETNSLAGRSFAYLVDNS